jgi:NADH-quinone oxidoreductase subunit J
MELVFFGITGLIAIIGAVAMLLSRNAVHSALFLLLNFSAIAVLFLLLRAPFLFAVQLIVYAGAIIVLFLFVLMLLGAERAEDDRDPLGWQRWVALGMAVVLLGEAVYVALTRPGVALVPAGASDDFATPERIAQTLFTTSLLPFEVTSFILLAAIIGVVVLSRRDSRRRG